RVRGVKGQGGWGGWTDRQQPDARTMTMQAATAGISTAAPAHSHKPFLVSRAEERRVIIASSVGTVFEWYDFYLYAVLAPFFAKLFFPPDNDTAALLAAFATYAAGFLVRPFGAVFF